MQIENSVILTMNVVIIVLFVWTVYKGYKDGFIATFISLITSVVLFFIAWPISKILSQHWIIYSYQGNQKIPTVLSKFITQNINQILWYAILIIFANLIVKVLIKLAKGINEAFIIGTLNRILGFVLGFAITVVYASIIGFILMSGIFKNGEDALDQTVLKLYHTPIKIGTQLGEEVLKNDSLLLSSLINQDKKLTEEEKNIVIKSLQEKGVNEEVINKLLPLIR